MTGSPLIRVGDRSREDVKRAFLAFWQEISPTVVRAVEDSFVSANMRHPTKAEVKRRIDMARELVYSMRVDFGWSKFRIRDNLQVALRAKLTGLAIDLDTLGKRSSW